MNAVGQLTGRTSHPLAYAPMVIASMLGLTTETAKLCTAMALHVERRLFLSAGMHGRAR